MLAAMSFTEMDAFAALNQIKTEDDKIREDDESYWQNVRQLFPLSKDTIYLNNGTMGPSPYPVIEAVHNGMMDCDRQGSYGGWEATSAKLGKFIGADEDEIALTHNVTDGINIVCWGLPLKRRDEVILTTHEHVGNAFPWLNRMKLHGILIKTFTPASTADETLERVAALITKRTRAIAVPHVPCTQGQILPVKEICALAKDRGIYSVIDGAHGPGMLDLNLHDMGCDTYASCCHKWMLGPKGTGFLYVKKELQEALQPYFVGGGSGGKIDWNMNLDPLPVPDYAYSAHRYYGGTQASGLYKGVNASIDFIETIGIKNISRRIKYLGKYTQDRLLELGGKIELLTPTEKRSRCAINGFRIKGVKSDDLYKVCNEKKVRIRVVPENGLDSLRVSTHIYNNKTEIDTLIDLVRKAI
jgi:cysteine desulfurase / selenocysteine lyase